MPLIDHRVIDRLSSVRPETAPEHRSLQPRAVRGDDGSELFRRAKFLLPQDRLLIELAFKNEMSIRQIARATGKPPGSVSRKVMRLCKRLREPTVIVLIDPTLALPLAPEHRQLAIEHLVQGQSARQLAELHEMPVPEVQRMLEYVKGWCKGVMSTSRVR